ncbi:hypothetical protein SADUNF_Sadunf14G0104400 [Salix dunnii]|uniref:RING-type E3 ubiquitin transferase n=1 Tax=Salix dunnii TaxID=1413687 RepID=A0A835JHH0_9ROSI|nr:hypothetical protein SADUNF_Sadunf14G0104400 [Salix dunnii]
MMIPWGGVSCCLSAAALYLLGRSSGRDAEVLKSVAKVNQLKELAKLLDIESKVLPLVVAISGRVGAESPISCEFSGLRGVIVEETAEQHFLKHNDAGSWIQDSALMLSMSKEVPWYLDDGTDQVYVVGARGASGFVLTVGSEVFEESGRSLVRGTLDYLQGLKMLGVKRIERVLPTGTSLTVVGEAVKDDIGTVRIQRPHKGPFYVSPKSIDELIGNLGKWARWYKYASLGLTVFGAFLIAKHVILYIMERKRCWELQSRYASLVEGIHDKMFQGKGHDSSLYGALGDICIALFKLYLKHTWNELSYGLLVIVTNGAEKYGSCRVLAAAAAKRSDQDNEGSDGKAENGSDGAKRERPIPDLCVICLEQEYNAVFLPIRRNAIMKIFVKVWSYVLLYSMLFAFEQLSSLSKTDRAGSEDFPPLKYSFQD